MSEARDLALSLAETAEQDQQGMASGRVRGKIFATVPDADQIRVMVDKDDIRAVVAQGPGACDAFWWGSRLASVVVDLRSAPGQLVKELLHRARITPATFVWAALR